jgi:hypothetical protein
MDVQEVEAAIERLTRAVDRLAAVSARRVADDKRVAADLASAQQARSHLEDLTGSVAGRLDGAIFRLRTALGD